MLVRPARTAASTVRGMRLKRNVGALVLVMIEGPWLVEELTRTAYWERFDRRSESWVLADAPAKVAQTYLARVGSWKVPTLIATVQAPTIRPDGAVPDKPGYDFKTGLLFDPGGVEFPPVQSHPTLEHARASLAVLLDLLKGFPFSGLQDTSVALSAILTSLVRRSIKSAPLHAFSAPKMASGKSLLADVVAMIATGKTAAVMPYVDDSNEERKRILAALIGGDAVICVDNIEKPWGSDCLCSVLTQEFYQDRLLGVSKNIIVPTCTTWLATGNNITFVGDLTTRVLPCFLDPQTDRPEERKFKVNLYALVPEKRSTFVQAALTILRGYQAAGRPDVGLKPFGRFEQWSHWVKSALVWVGCADPCLSRERIEATDPIRQQLSILLESWCAIFGRTPVTVNDINKQIEGDPEDQAANALKECVEEIAGTQGKKVNTRRFGNRLQKYKMRIERGKRLEAVGNRGHCAKWRVVEVDGHEKGTQQANVSLGSLCRPPTEEWGSYFDFNGDGVNGNGEGEKKGQPAGQNSSNSPNSPPEDRVDQWEEWEV